MTDIVAQGMAAAASEQARGVFSRTVTKPASFGWDTTDYPLGTVSVVERLGAPARGSVGLNPFSSAEYAACAAGTQYYVQLTGNDTNSGTSQAAPLATINKAVELANATGQPATINLIGGASSTYLGRVASAFGSTPKPSVDLLIRPAGSERVMLGTFDLGAYTWADNATYSWVKQTARSNALRLINPASMTARGLWADYTKMTSLLLCSQTPGSWFTDGTNVYVNPFAGQTLSDATVRILLNVTLFNWTPNGTNALPNLFMENLDFVGGSTSNLCVVASSPSTPWPKRTLAARNCSFRYGGGTANTGGVYINGWNGLVYFEGCDASAPWSDSFNWHNGPPSTNAVMNAITINCTGFDTGRGGAGIQSNNGLTGHDDNLIAIDIAGRYGDARGRTVHFTEASKLWAIATQAGPSYGDIGNGGAFTPVEFFADNSVQMWLDGVDPRPAGAANYGILAGGSSTINVRNLPATARTATISTGAVVAY